MIDEFKGKYYFLSNFYYAPVVYKGVKYSNNEAAFQAQKTFDPKEQKRIAESNPSLARKLGRKVTLRPDWESMKLSIMEEICRAKFQQNPELMQKLIDTDNETLIEGNYWHDTYWGVCNGKGENNLGKILMKIRGEQR